MSALKRERIKRGDIFGRLTVLTDEPLKDGGKARVEVRCSCGTFKSVLVSCLIDGRTKSCRCLWRETRKNFSHGHAVGGKPTKVLRAWRHLMERCYNPNCSNYDDYGGRGIIVCEEWRNDFLAFYRHIGDPPTALHSIDRIENNGNYEPGNIRWATRKEQSENRRNNRFVTHNGKTLTVFGWAAELGVNKWTLAHRITQLGWDPLRAVTTPIGKHTKRHEKEKEIQKETQEKSI